MARGHESDNEDEETFDDFDPAEFGIEERKSVEINPGKVKPAKPSGRPRRPALRILHRDSDLIVVDKPAGLGTQPRDEAESSIVEELLAAGADQAAGALFEVMPVDPDVSGVTLLSFDEQMRDALLEQLKDRRMELTVLAVVQGPLMQDHGVLDRPLVERPGGADRVRVGSEGTPAITQWKLLDAFVGYALIECTPRTAARHQVRAHLESAGMPLAVDSVYRGAADLRLSRFKAGYRKSRRREERPLIARPSLHVSSVRFLHPRTEQAIEFKAPLPKDMRAALHQLDRFGRIGMSGR